MPLRTPLTRLSIRSSLHLPSLAAAQQVRFYEVPHTTTFDQTKKNNKPTGEEDKSAKPQQKDDNDTHPQKQADPQKSPSSSTGIETKGPDGSEAGKGSGGG